MARMENASNCGPRKLSGTSAEKQWLFDQQNRQIDSITLQRGTAFVLSDGALVIYGPFSGLRGGSGNLGAGVEYEGVKLHLASSGGILGHKSVGGVMLLGYFIPVAGTRVRAMFWPQLAK